MASLPPIGPFGGPGSLPPLGPQALGAPMLPPMPAPLAPASPLAGLPVSAEPEQKPSAISKLGPSTDLHREVLTKLKAMFSYSKREMTKTYSRWNFMEMKIQAYIANEDYDRLMNGLKPGAAPPESYAVVVPYTYATLHAAATFIAAVLLGQKPVFPLVGARNTTQDKARYMEQALQSNLDMNRGYEVIWQKIWDSLIYSFGAVRVGWEEKYSKAMRLSAGQREVSTQLSYAGNKLSAIDPYRFFPDPRVPLSQVNERGDFVFWEEEQSELTLKDMESAGVLKWVKEGISKRRNQVSSPVTESNRRARIGMDGSVSLEPANVTGFHSVREGTVRLIPADWKLGDSKESELWKFTWLNDSQIVAAEPLGMLHEMHPVVVSEPTSFGHDFLSLSMADMIGPFQDLISWLVNSRMENVRSTINNQFIADPARVELNDIRTSAIGRIIRMKQAAMGLPINDAIRQLVVQDVTSGHVGDIQILRTLADMITGVNDNLRGIQTAGGRRSATEARMSMQAGGNRLSQFAIRTSTQSMLPLAAQMISNIQQYMPDELWAEIAGDDGPQSTLMTPDMLIGQFNYQISDGSLPYDKAALVEVWKEILVGVMQDPELRQQNDVNKIFDYTAQLGGAKNISAFKRAPVQGQLQVAPPGVDPSQGAVPMGAAMPAAPAALAFGGR